MSHHAKASLIGNSQCAILICFLFLGSAYFLLLNPNTAVAQTGMRILLFSVHLLFTSVLICWYKYAGIKLFISKGFELSLYTTH